MTPDPLNDVLRRLNLSVSSGKTQTLLTFHPWGVTLCATQYFTRLKDKRYRCLNADIRDLLEYLDNGQRATIIISKFNSKTMTVSGSQTKLWYRGDLTGKATPDYYWTFSFKDPKEDRARVYKFSERESK
jgi:hypothetical protein